MKSTRHIAVLALAVVALASAAMASAASAAPAWKFNGTELAGSETIVGAAISSKLTIPGATTECAHFLYNMKISNSAGTGKGEITELPLFECTASGSCTVESIAAEKLNWPTHLTTIAGKDYLIIENIRVGIKYSGSLCALSGTLTVVKGTAGGLIENETQTAKFNKTTFTATGTSLKVGSSSVEWEGLFPTEGFETHREQAIEG
ncbi:MAG TPA: hypothetical protein VK756_01015 [Solirubrobacteraceae bacterium]|jgi:hypothetical protein|nr:hypothetical protein [Solirubrobacteraceae bacterium]